MRPQLLPPDAPEGDEVVQNAVASTLVAFPRADQAEGSELSEITGDGSLRLSLIIRKTAHPGEAFASVFVGIRAQDAEKPKGSIRHGRAHDFIRDGDVAPGEILVIFWYHQSNLT